MDMATTTAASDWQGARGERWRAHLDGTEATLRPVDEPLLRALRLERPCRIADIGCGGGGTAQAILRAAPAGSTVAGFDIAPGLVAVARERARDERAIAFEVADVGTAAPPAPYDRLASRFGIMFFDDPPAAFANLFRWLVPGGRLAFAAWGPLRDNPWMTIVRDTAAEVVEVPATDPDAPGPFRYGEAGTLLGVLEGAGFAELDARDWRGTLRVGGGLPAAEAATFALAAFGPFGELLAKAGDEALEHARRSLTARIARHEEGGVVRMDARVHVVTGTRPR
jgi:SAM-dependent methyltransferase